MFSNVSVCKVKNLLDPHSCPEHVCEQVFFSLSLSMISPENYSSFWDQPDLMNCKDIEDIEVSQGDILGGFLSLEVSYLFLVDDQNNQSSR